MLAYGADDDQKRLISALFFAEERLIDCCDIIADALVKYASATGTFNADADLNDEEKRRKIKKLFADKYEMLDLNSKE